MTGEGPREVLGVDIGGTSIKAAPVDVDAGRVLAGEPATVDTPSPGTADQLVEAVASLRAELSWADGRPLGATFPGAVRFGVVHTAVNLDGSNVGVDLAARLGGTVLNDADAAGVAEARFGAARDCRGTVVLVTLGTGLGTALLHGGRLVPNCELGAVEIGGRPASDTVSRKGREDEGLDWSTYADHVAAYVRRLEVLVDPELVVLGGGGSEEAEHFLPQVRDAVDVRVVRAAYENEAGILGAALAAGLAALGRARPTNRGQWAIAGSEGLV
jgi:polyphosphate glucokinase